MTDLSIGLSRYSTKGFCAWIQGQDGDCLDVHDDRCTDDAGAVCRQAAEELRLLADAFDALATMDNPCTPGAQKAAMTTAAELRGQEDSND